MALAASFNHQYIEYSEQVYSRYAKAVVAVVCGVRIDPVTKTRTEFMLKSTWGKFDLESESLVFDYATDVIEIYSAEEDRIFRVLNRYLFQKGMLVPYDATRGETDMTSALSDSELSTLATTKNLLQFKKLVKDLSSKVTLKRLLTSVEAADRPVSFIRVVEQRINELP